MHWCLNVILAFYAIIGISLSANICNIGKSGADITCTCRNINISSVGILCPNNIDTLNLDYNQFKTLYNNSFITFYRLKSLSLNQCQIEKIEAYAFHNLSTLEELDLGNNSFKDTTLPKRVFRFLSSLYTLNIGSNSFSDYPNEQLTDLKVLKTLIIKGIQRKILGEGFSALHRLEKLFLRPCEISSLTNETFINLRDIPLQHIELKCEIYKVELLAFLPLKYLTSLKMSSNNKIKLSEFIPSLAVFKNRNMTLLDLDNTYNFIKHKYDILSAKDGKILGDMCITILDLGVNNIQTIQQGFFKNMKYKDCLKGISLTDNSIIGEFGAAFNIHLFKNLLWFDMSRQTFAYSFRNLQSRILNSVLTESHLIPTIDISSPPNLKFFNISRVELKGTPFDINLKIINGHMMQTLDISYLNLISFQGTIQGLVNLQNLYFSNSNCSNLSPRFFRGFPNLRHLTFQNAELKQVLQNNGYKKLLFEMNHLQYIDFSGNNLYRLIPDLLTKQRHILKEFILENNMFVDIPFIISEFSQITSINMRQNKIEQLSEKTREDIDNAISLGQNFTIYLENNPLKCNCESMDFIDWLFTTKAVFDQDKDYPCLFTDGTTKSTLWSYHRGTRIKIACISDTVLYISLALTIILTTFILIGALVYKCRVPVTFWFYNMRRKYRLLKNLDMTTDYKYDVFVAYHHSDFSIVKTKIVNYLEEQKHLKLCVHQRDFIAGEYIGDNIMAAIKHSKKVLMLISTDFIKSHWGMFELDMARMQMFQDDRNLIVVIFLEDLTYDEMPASLKDIWERIVCIESDENLHNNLNPSDDQLVWKKLHEAVVA